MKQPRNLIGYRVAGDVVDILAVSHERMDIERRLMADNQRCCDWPGREVGLASELFTPAAHCSDELA